MGIYNIKTGQNTVLRGLIAEEFARYTLSQRFPIIIVRPKLVLDYLEEASITGQSVSFLNKYQKTMDYFGIAPITLNTKPRISVRDIVCRFFYKIEGLGKFLLMDEMFKILNGFIIEVKSRTNKNPWAPFQYSFSSKQNFLLNKSKRFGFKIILCGVTLEENWNISVIYTGEFGKIIQEDFFYNI